MVLAFWLKAPPPSIFITAEINWLKLAHNINCFISLIAEEIKHLWLPLAVIIHTVLVPS